MKTIGVLTCDILNAGNLNSHQINAAIGFSQSVADDLSDFLGFDLRFTRQLGYGFQVVIEDPRYLLRSAICFRSGIRSLGGEFNCCIGIGSGVSDAVIGKNLNLEMGEAFICSGRALSEGKRMGCGFWDSSRQRLPLVILLSALVDRWSASTCMYMSKYLSSNLRQTSIARSFGVSRAAVCKGLKGAHRSHILEVLRIHEENIHA